MVVSLGVYDRKVRTLTAIQTTRTSTQRLPARRETLAELQATQAEQSKSKSASKKAVSLKDSKKRLASESQAVDDEAASSPPARAQRAARVDAELRVAGTEKPEAKTKPKKARASASKSSSEEVNQAPPLTKVQRTAAVDAILQQFPVPVTQPAITDPQKFDPASKTTFLSLPAEIRNEIYSLALIEDAPVRVLTTRPYLLEPALLAIGKQVRSEALGLWYGENVFEIDGSSPAVKFLRATSDYKLRALRCLRISTTFVPAADYIRTRTEQLLREFQPRGLNRQAIHFMLTVEGELEWVNLARLRRIERGQNSDVSEKK